VLLQPKLVLSCRSTAGSPDRPVRTEQAPTTRVSPHSHPPRVLLQPKTRHPPVGAPPPVRTEQALPTRANTHSHPPRVLLQAARPCRSTAPGANVPLTLSLFLMLLIQQVNYLTRGRIPLHSRQQRLAHKLIIIITHRLAQRIKNGQQRVPVQKHLIGAVNFRMGSGLRVIPDRSEEH